MICIKSLTWDASQECQIEIVPPGPGMPVCRGAGRNSVGVTAWAGVNKDEVGDAVVDGISVSWPGTWVTVGKTGSVLVAVGEEVVASGPGYGVETTVDSRVGEAVGVFPGGG